MGRLKVIPFKFAHRLARTTGLRNRVVHAYETVDLRLMHRALGSLVRDYNEYVRRVGKHAGL
jgi:uncharacterized protein YutE (UPF0331/DUF86 family)